MYVQMNIFIIFNRIGRRPGFNWKDGACQYSTRFVHPSVDMIEWNPCVPCNNSSNVVYAYISGKESVRRDWSEKNNWNKYVTVIFIGDNLNSVLNNLRLKCGTHELHVFNFNFFPIL